MLDNFFNFINKDLWVIHTEQLSKWKSFWIKFLRIILLTIQGFTNSKISLWASGLTYYSLISFVPIIAILIGIARGFRMESSVEQWLYNKFSDQKEIITKVLQFAEASLQHSRQGIIAGLGVALLVWAVIKILRNIEEAFNSTWEVSEMRSIGRQCTDYLAMILLTPVFVLLTSGVTVFLTSEIRSLENRNIFLETIGPALFIFVGIISYALSFLTFTFLYMFMPNVKVKFLPALIAGIITGSIYQLVQWIYLAFQIGVSEYNAVYGTFAALPLFLIWLQISWIVVLIGAKIAYSIQNVDAFELMPQQAKISRRMSNLLSLKLAYLCIKNNSQDKPAPSNRELAKHLSIPLVLTNALLKNLEDAGVLSKIKYKNKEDPFYIPAKNINHLTVYHVLTLLKEYGKEQPPVKEGHDTKVLLHCLKEFDHLAENSNANILLKDI